MKNLFLWGFIILLLGACKTRPDFPQAGETLVFTSDDGTRIQFILENLGETRLAIAGEGYYLSIRRDSFAVSVKPTAELRGPEGSVKEISLPIPPGGWEKPAQRHPEGWWWSVVRYPPRTQDENGWIYFPRVGYKPSPLGGTSL